MLNICTLELGFFIVIIFHEITFQIASVLRVTDYNQNKVISHYSCCFLFWNETGPLVSVGDTVLGERLASDRAESCSEQKSAVSGRPAAVLPHHSAHSLLKPLLHKPFSTDRHSKTILTLSIRFECKYGCIYFCWFIPLERFVWSAPSSWIIYIFVSVIIMHLCHQLPQR